MLLAFFPWMEPSSCVPGRARDRRDAARAGVHRYPPPAAREGKERRGGWLDGCGVISSDGSMPR